MTTCAEPTRALPDFEVRYRFYAVDEDGRKNGPPFHNYRCDWAYEGDDISKTGIYMIWPEFVGSDGSSFPEGIQVPAAGTATMWILNPQIRTKVHQSRIKEGVRGFFMEGGKRVAEAVVTRVIGMHKNTT